MRQQDSAAVLDMLGDAPRRLTALAHTPEPRWRRRPAEGGWSAAEVLAHIRACDDIIAPRLLQILASDEPLLIAFEDARWQDVAGYDLLAPARSIATFAARREELIAALRRRPAEDWQRGGIHEAKGPQTLLQIAAGIVAHEREHLDTIEALLASPA